MTDGKMMLMPAKKGTCPECAVVHAPEMPHNAQSLYYQVKFQMEHDRPAKWSDAMAHCSEEVKAIWIDELRKAGISEEQLVTGTQL
ncbi:MAG: hypothetical protein WC356_03510 [Candidatus Micrarchaeia archaeon]